MENKPSPLNTNNDEIKKYYDSIKEKAISLFSNKETKEKAIFLIEEELDQPYIPNETFEEFNNLLNDFQSSMKLDKIKELQSNYTVKSLLQDAIIGKQFDLVIFEHIATSNPDEINLAINELKLFFVNDKIRTFNKIFVLEILNRYAIYEDFEFLNIHTKKLIKLNSKNFLDIFNKKEYIDTLNNINDLTLKEPTITNFATDVLLHINSYFFPEFEFESIDQLGTKIINKIMIMMGNEDYKFTEDEDDKKIELVIASLSEEK